MTAERHGFQAEVSRLLDIVAHSLYSDKSVFLRELISNASDACDKLRYLSLTQSGLMGDDPDLAVVITIDKANRTLTIADNGIGMSHDELIANLGTIARSGSAQFMNELAQETSADKKVSLIGQFGVGFYSAFMVADKVTVTSKRATVEPGENAAFKWESEGKGEFTVTPAEKKLRGTEIALHIKAGEEQWLETDHVAKVVAKYSDHIALPVRLTDGSSQKHVNQAAALWTRSKSDITPEQYTELYHHIAHAFDEPWATLHFKAEGKIDYTGLIFIPSAKPFDLFHPDRKQSLKLYVKRVFITDHCENLLPSWLRFLKGIVDSEDLPLNISRETLQANPLIAKIRAGLIKRVIGELQKIAENEPDRYAKFWEDFGAVLKEGIYEDESNREALLKLARFRTTANGTNGGDGLTSLADYVGRMKEGQSGIYTISGDELAALQRSPHLEGFKAKGVEVLLLTDAVDEFWMQAVTEYEGKPFKSATRGAADLDGVKQAEGAPEKKDEPKAEGIDNLVALMRLTLKDAVKDVRLSDRLTESACVLVAAEGDLDIHLEKLLRQHKKLETALPRVLEINGTHPMIAALSKAISKGGQNETLADACWLLLDQARIQDGEPLPDPAAFARRMNALMQRAV
jgi:molecular chaperone HtpG